jgi:hypothetical protein
MYELSGILATPEQKFSYDLEGVAIFFTFHYHLATQMWYMDFSYGDFSLNGYKLKYGLNILYQWKNILTFGIEVVVASGYEPMFIDDFSSARITFNILTTGEKNDISDYFRDNK